MSDVEVVVLGAGGHAKVVVAALCARGARVAAVLSDRAEEWGRTVLGVAVSGPISPQGYEALGAVVAIGDNGTRREVAARGDWRWVTVVHPRAWVHESVALGAGAMVMAGAVVQPEAVVGRHAIVNTGASVDHDSVVGDFVHIGPGARLAGSTRIGSGALIGVGASLIPGVTIGEGAVVGAGSVVVRDVAPGARVAGNPARTL